MSRKGAGTPPHPPRLPCSDMVASGGMHSTAGASEDMLQPSGAPVSSMTADAGQRRSARASGCREATCCGLSAFAGIAKARAVKSSLLSDAGQQQWDRVRLQEEADAQRSLDKPEPEAEAETYIIEVQTLQQQLGEATRERVEAQRKCSVLERKFRDEHGVLQQHLAEREVELMDQVARANSQAAKQAEEASAKSAENRRLLEEVRELREETAKMRAIANESKLQAASNLQEAVQRMGKAQEAAFNVASSSEKYNLRLLERREGDTLKAAAEKLSRIKAKEAMRAKREDESLEEEVVALQEQVRLLDSDSTTSREGPRVSDSILADADAKHWLRGRLGPAGQSAVVQTSPRTTSPRQLPQSPRQLPKSPRQLTARHVSPTVRSPVGSLVVQHPGVRPSPREKSPEWKIPSLVPDESDVPEDCDAREEETEALSFRMVPSSMPAQGMAPSVAVGSRAVAADATPGTRSPMAPPGWDANQAASARAPLQDANQALPVRSAALTQSIPISSAARATFSNYMASPEQQFREFRERSAPLATITSSSLPSPEPTQAYRELTAPLPYRELTLSPKSVTRSPLLHGVSAERMYKVSSALASTGGNLRGASHQVFKHGASTVGPTRLLSSTSKPPVSTPPMVHRGVLR